MGKSNITYYDRYDINTKKISKNTYNFTSYQQSLINDFKQLINDDTDITPIHNHLDGKSVKIYSRVSDDDGNYNKNIYILKRGKNGNLIVETSNLQYILK